MSQFMPIKAHSIKMPTKTLALTAIGLLFSVGLPSVAHANHTQQEEDETWQMYLDYLTLYDNCVDSSQSAAAGNVSIAQGNLTSCEQANGVGSPACQDQRDALDAALGSYSNAEAGCETYAAQADMYRLDWMMMM